MKGFISAFLFVIQLLIVFLVLLGFVLQNELALLLFYFPLPLLIISVIQVLLTKNLMRKIHITLSIISGIAWLGTAISIGGNPLLDFFR
ncbi:MAG: hypothetical protein A3C01_02655 [Candidatus Yanofskybacteria bacterium RIFCSPHIGHO2_02_FULL_44_36b]|uniref:Uncharacterized protein n=1 Tax=Candidatus Yanofskybacteria bacterium RIFCSPLOWO2_02_FULL_44_18 TaxID=1802705 RepID=A0A1F8H0X4_9BACT|nr:MAG: hypothetical protein A3C01_02655 [Candidatus Yanofskybacteria bacterium RIFCSPHIGHO2_02_FULL_44_36b]OGN31335.1 MAG: hypothetical protein A3I96_00640 [Candidatus Yanofskybacteria bacterium RIFCSPLOWO2_02_FULL_44_18]